MKPENLTKNYDLRFIDNMEKTYIEDNNNNDNEDNNFKEAMYKKLGNYFNDKTDIEILRLIFKYDNEYVNKALKEYKNDKKFDKLKLIIQRIIARHKKKTMLIKRPKSNLNIRDKKIKQKYINDKEIIYSSPESSLVEDQKKLFGLKKLNDDSNITSNYEHLKTENYQKPIIIDKSINATKTSNFFKNKNLKKINKNENDLIEKYLSNNHKIYFNVIIKNNKDTLADFKKFYKENKKKNDIKELLNNKIYEIIKNDLISYCQKIQSPIKKKELEIIEKLLFDNDEKIDKFFNHLAVDKKLNSFFVDLINSVEKVKIELLTSKSLDSSDDVDVSEKDIND
jgi:hypothetical protein